MRKEKWPPVDPPFVYLRDVLPELAEELRVRLRRVGERALSEQVRELRIYGRCCNASPCGRFYCLPQEQRRALILKGLARDLFGVDVTVAKSRIIAVETLDSNVDAALSRIFRRPENDFEPTEPCEPGP
jgi:hypothetical protein